MKDIVKIRVERNKYTNPEAPKYLGVGEFTTHISGKTYKHDSTLARGNNSSQVLKSSHRALEAQLNQIGVTPYTVL